MPPHSPKFRFQSRVLSRSLRFLLAAVALTAVAAKPQPPQRRAAPPPAQRSVSSFG